MAWRIVYISDVNKLSLNLNSLKIVKGDDEFKIPLSDIFAVVIEDLTVTITTRLLVELSDYNILVIFCNQKHLPECMIQPVSGHYRQYSQTRQQLSWDTSRKEELWKLIVKKKIENQIECMKHCSIHSERNVDYFRLIKRLERMLPLIVEEMEQISNKRTLLIYAYPEANLSPKEQIQFRRCLESLNIPVIVLTGSSHFLSKNLMGMNYIRNHRQLINDEFIKQLVWNAPMNYELVDIMESLKKFIQLYQDKFEILPLISNYRLADIMLFEPIDLYVGLSFMKYANQGFNVDIQFNRLPSPVAQYIQTVIHNKKETQP